MHVDLEKGNASWGGEGIRRRNGCNRSISNSVPDVTPPTAPARARPRGRRNGWQTDFGAMSDPIRSDPSRVAERWRRMKKRSVGATTGAKLFFHGLRMSIVNAGGKKSFIGIPTRGDEIARLLPSFLPFHRSGSARPARFYFFPLSQTFSRGHSFLSSRMATEIHLHAVAR